MLSALVRDIRFAIRSLAGSPLLTGVAVLSLALGIGANTAIFTLFDQVLVRMLPVSDPASLVMVATRGNHVGSNRGRNMQSYPMYRDYREQNDVFEGMLCRRAAVVNLGIEEGTERADAELVSGNYFEVLGVRPALGRLFSMDDETARGQNPVVVLNNDFWRLRFAADPGVIGQVLRVNGQPMTIVGVAAAGFRGVSLGYHPKLHVPVTMKDVVTPSWDDYDDRRTRWVQVYARLKDGVQRETAEASIRTLHKQIITMESQEPYFDDVTAYGKEQFLKSDAVVLPGGQGDSSMRNSLDTPLRVLMGFVGLLLLITCANVSNLLVAKAMSRQKEIAIRLAVGASQRHIFGQLLVESSVLALIGGALGLLVGYFAAEALVLLAPEEQRLALTTTPDARILGFSFAVTTFAALGFGLVPALSAARTNLVATIKQHAGASSASHGMRVRRMLVVVQVVVALLLVLGSALFVQSLRNLGGVEPGFSTTNLVRFKLDPMLSGYDVARTKELYRRLSDRLTSLPGVEAAGLAVVAIMEGNEWDSTVTVEGYRSAEGEDMNPHFNSISPGYFDAMGISIKAGRDFGDGDVEGGKPVVIVNETFARQYFGEKSPLGFHMAFGGGPSVVPDMEIIAVVEDAKYEDLRGEVPRQVFVAYQQNDWASEMTAYVRGAASTSALFSGIRSEVGELDGTMPLFDMNTMDDQLDRSLAIERLVAFLSSAFGILAAVLAFVGLYGVTAYSVSRRASEIGLRMALGARASGVVGMILKEVLVLTTIGLAIAIPTAWWLSELVSSQLYGVEARDPVSMLASTLTLVTVTLLAGLLPALRASRLHPVSVLRAE